MKLTLGNTTAGRFATLAVAAALAASPAAADSALPQAARAALVARPAQMRSQPAVVQSLGLNWVLRAFRSHAALGERGETFTVMVVPVGAGHETVGLARGKQDVTPVFESLRDTPAGTIGSHAIFRVQRSPDYMARLGTREIVEGSAPALRRVLEPPRADGARRDLEGALMAPSALPPQPAAATLFYLSNDGGASLAQILRDLDAIWSGLGRLVAPYETPMKLLGDMRGGRADVWQDADSVRVHLLFVSTGDLEAKRSLMALRTARQLAPLASDAAVRAGTLTQKDADLVRRVLETMRSRAVDDQIHVDLAVDAATIQPQR